MQRQPDWEALQELNFLLSARIGPLLNEAINSLALSEMPNQDTGRWRERARIALANILNMYQAWVALIEYKSNALISRHAFRSFPVQSLMDWLSIQMQLTPPAKADNNIELYGHQPALQEALFLLYSVAASQGTGVHFTFEADEKGGWFRIPFISPKSLHSDIDTLIKSFGTHWRSQVTAFELELARDFVRLNNSTLELHQQRNRAAFTFFIHRAGIETPATPYPQPSKFISPETEYARFVANIEDSMLAYAHMGIESAKGKTAVSDKGTTEKPGEPAVKTALENVIKATDEIADTANSDSNDEAEVAQKKQSIELIKALIAKFEDTKPVKSVPDNETIQESLLRRGIKGQLPTKTIISSSSSPVMESTSATAFLPDEDTQILKPVKTSDADMADSKGKAESTEEEKPTQPVPRMAPQAEATDKKPEIELAPSTNPPVNTVTMPPENSQEGEPPPPEEPQNPANPAGDVGHQESRPESVLPSDRQRALSPDSPAKPASKKSHRKTSTMIIALHIPEPTPPPGFSAPPQKPSEKSESSSDKSGGK